MCVHVCVVSKAAAKAAKAAAKENVESAEASTLAALGKGYVKIVLKEGAKDGRGRQVVFVKDCESEELHCYACTTLRRKFMRTPRQMRTQ